MENIIEIKSKDITNNWVESSRFLFYVKICCILTLFVSNCVALYTSRYKGKAEVEVQKSSTYKPTYN